MEVVSDTLAELTLAEFSERLASAQPVPGGGSTSAIAACFAASLLSMVARLSLGRPRYQAFEDTNERALQAGERARVLFLDLADDDARAYATFAAAMKLPRDTDEQQVERRAVMRQAARTAASVPLTVVRESAALLDEIESLTGRSNLNAASDLEVAARLCTAAARGAAANVLVNLPHTEDERFTGVTTAEVGELLQAVDRNMSRVAQRVAQGGLREPERA